MFAQILVSNVHYRTFCILWITYFWFISVMEYSQVADTWANKRGTSGAVLKLTQWHSEIDKSAGLNQKAVNTIKHRLDLGLTSDHSTAIRFWSKASSVHVTHDCWYPIIQRKNRKYRHCHWRLRCFAFVVAELAMALTQPNLSQYSCNMQYLFRCYSNMKIVFIQK